MPSGIGMTDVAAAPPQHSLLKKRINLFLSTPQTNKVRSNGENQSESGEQQRRSNDDEWSLRGLSVKDLNFYKRITPGRRAYSP